MTRTGAALLLALLAGGCATTPAAGERIAWQSSIGASLAECIRRGTPRLACYDPAADEIVIWRGAPRRLLNHERCHRGGWRHPDPMPAECE